VSRKKPKLGDVVQITLPTDRYAYGRVLRDASVAFYRETTDDPGQPPIGSRDFQFVVGVYDDVLKDSPVVGHDPSRHPEEDWPPPYCVRDPISGEVKLYHKGAMRPASAEECEGLEPAAVWDLQHLVDRLMGVREGPG
jgi:immunity protein 26 of polymorphic toxin system